MGQYSDEKRTKNSKRLSGKVLGNQAVLVGGYFKSIEMMIYWGGSQKLHSPEREVKELRWPALLESLG